MIEVVGVLTPDSLNLKSWDEAKFTVAKHPNAQLSTDSYLTTISDR